MFLQAYNSNNKHGEIHRIRGKRTVYQYRSKSGKTVREYGSIKELIEAENGKQAQEPVETS